MLARGLHEQGDLDAVVDVELVEEAGDVGLDRGDGEEQRRGDLGVGVAAADSEGDVVLAWAERGHAVAGVVGAGGRVGVAGHHGDEPACDCGGEHRVAVVVLTTFDADELVLRALQAGAAGFLLKDTPPAEIVRAIELVHAGDGMLSPAVTRRLIALVADEGGAAARHDGARELLDSLSPREREVALAVGRGLPNAEIAAELHMSVATVKAHVSRLLVKLGVENRVQIALLVQDATDASR